MKRTPIGPWFAVFCGLLVGAAAPPALAQANPADAGYLVRHGEKPDLLLFYTGDVIGYLEDCGCKKNPAGGLARKAWIVDQVKQKYPGTPALLLDSGNFSDNPTPEGDVKTQALLEAMKTLGYEVINVGERDIRMGYDELRKRTADAPFQFISANLVRRDNQEPVFKPHVVVELSTGEGKPVLRVGVIGVMRYNPLFVKAGPDGSNLVVVHPTDVVRKSVADLEQKQVDRIVLLAAMSKEDATRIVQEVPGIDYLLGSYGGVATDNPEREGETTVIYCGNRGQRIAETRIFRQDAKQDTTMVHFLTREYPVDRLMADFVRSVPKESGSAAAGEADPQGAEEGGTPR